MMNRKVTGEINGWRITQEKTLLQTRVGEIVSAQVQSNRTGRQEEFYRLIFSDWVNILALTQEREIVLIKQFRFGSERMEIEIPGGAIEPHESPVVAGSRELLEETGYAGKNARVIGEVCPNPAIQNNRCYTVFIEDVEQVAEQNMDEMEDIEVSVVPLAVVHDLMTQGEIDHGLVMNAFMFFEKQGL